MTESTKKSEYNDIEEYIANFPVDTQEILRKLRRTILKSAPGAIEVIKYGIPTFKLNGNLVHFAALKNHIGFYPTPSAIEAFKKQLSAYYTSKGAIKFPIDKPIPYQLIKEIVKFRVKEVLAKKQILDE